MRSALLPALAAFASAARHQNFAHAAEELHLTASAVSHHVRKLETALGVSLFQRHARGVALTLKDVCWPTPQARPWPRSNRCSTACVSTVATTGCA